MDKKIATLSIIYLILGLIFAIVYALFYHWEALSFLSPNFYIVIISWPIQLPGFISDFLVFGFQGKTLF